MTRRGVLCCSSPVTSACWPIWCLSLAFAQRIKNISCLKIWCSMETDVVFFRYTKNHRRQRHRYSITVRPKHLIRELLCIRDRKRVMPRLVSVGELNSALDGQNSGVTSYSLRRRFIHQVIAENTVGDVVDWLSCARLTGHRNLEVLRTSYAPKFSTNL